MKYVHEEVKALLEAFGYKPEVREYETESGVANIDLYFHVNNGSNTMPVRHKDAIAMLAKGFLAEFYYGNDTQHVYLHRDNKGLNPDDDRYGCLLHEIKLVNDDLIPVRGTEVFVNMGDHFKRFVNWIEMSSTE